MACRGYVFPSAVVVRPEEKSGTTPATMLCLMPKAKLTSGLCTTLSLDQRDSDRIQIVHNCTSGFEEQWKISDFRKGTLCMRYAKAWK